MKKVTEHAGFAQASELQAKLQDEYSRLSAEQMELQSRLAYDNVEPVHVPGTIEQAAALLDGKQPLLSRAAALEAMRNREQEVRQRLEVISKALTQQPSVIERERERARAEAIRLRTKETEAIAAKWAKAQEALRDALAAEDALLDSLVAGGFGRTEPSVTAPFWLNRQLALRSI